MRKLLQGVCMMSLLFLIVPKPVYAAKDEAFTAKKTVIKDKRINKGGSFVLSLKGTSKNPTWKTSNKKVATITKKSKYKYKVKGVGVGDCTISVKAGKTTYKLTMHVESPSMPTSINFTVENPTNIVVKDITKSCKPVWTLQSGKNSIVKLSPSSNGHSCKITGLKNGTAYVYTTIAGRSYGCKLTVTHTCSRHLKWKTTKNPTCKATGTKAQYCTICGKTIKTASIAKTAHKYTYVTTKQPTCEGTGTQAEQCSFCGVKSGKTKSVPALGHDYKFVYDVPATCAVTGTKVHQCSRCNKLKTETIPKNTNHQWDNGRVIKKATASQVGKIEYTCSVCGTKKTEDITKIKTNSKISLSSPKIRKLKNVKRKKVIFSWTKVKNATSYQIQIKQGKKIKTYQTKKLSKTIKKLKLKKKYIFRVRAVRGKIYSKWVSKKIKIKK